MKRIVYLHWDMILDLPHTNLGYLKNRFPSTPILALTATDKATHKNIT
jgi:hypothetical protein